MPHGAHEHDSRELVLVHGKKLNDGRHEWKTTWATDTVSDASATGVPYGRSEMQPRIVEHSAAHVRVSPVVPSPSDQRMVTSTLYETIDLTGSRG